MRIMGLDFGDRTIGVAISDELHWTAQGIETIRRGTDEQDMGRIRELVEAYQVGEIVVGLPKNMNNTIGPRGEICIAFAKTLQETIKLPVHLRDERLTTVSAERALLEADISRKKRKQVIDKIAAVFILQSFLDARQPK